MFLKNFLDTKEKKVGFYSTIIFHLLMLIFFLVVSINKVVTAETAFVLDFTKQEAIEKEIKQQEMKEEVSKEIDDLLSGKTSAQQYRNVAVDRSSKALKDDRFKNPNQVYEEAKALQKKLDASRREAAKQQGADDVAVGQKAKEDTKAQTYTGPSVISYSLEGRKAISLPIPAYKCLGGGDVSVKIIVNKKGYVMGAEVISSVSSNDDCLRRFAVMAAKRSRFTASESASDKQQGEIVYRFIAQ